MHKSYILLLIASLSLFNNLYANVEEECISDASHTEKCRYFLKGYLYGISEMESKKLTAKQQSKPAKETFSERAIRTRLNAGQTRKTREKEPTTTYCLPELSDIKNIATNLQKEFNQDLEYWAEVNDPIGNALQKIYPC